MSSARLLTDDEVKWVVAMHSRHNLLPDKWKHIMSRYIKTVLRENANGTLVNHLNEPWEDGPSMRYGASSVIGTIIEMIVMVDMIRRGATDVEMTHDKLSQLSGVDITANIQNTPNNISVKKLCERPDGFIRFGQDYFPPKSIVDIIAFYDITRDVVHYQSFDACKDVFRVYDKTIDGDDVYIYRHKDWLLSPTEYCWTL